MLKDKKPELLNINGNRVLYFKIPNKTIYVESIIKTGFADENRNNCGINHLLEHVLTNAWDKCNNKSCMSYWNNKGGNYNAETHNHKIKYYNSGTKNMQDEIINYIIDITLNPKILKANLDNEKHAVKTELLGALNENDYTLYDTHNKNFYKIEGLKYSEDWKTQLKNLKNINLKSLLEWYNRYYKNNILFIVVGDIEKRELPKYFKKREMSTNNKTKNRKLIVQKKREQTLKKKCFSGKKQIVFSYLKEAKQVRLLIGFNSKIYQDNKELIYVKIVCNILKSIFYKILREEKKLIYSISVTSKTTECGTVTEIFTEVDHDKCKKIYEIIFATIRYYQKNYFANDIINGEKNKLSYVYNNTTMRNSKVVELYASQYFNQINSKNPHIYSLADMKKSISKVDKEILQKIFKNLFNINNSLTTYQYNKKNILQ